MLRDRVARPSIGVAKVAPGIVTQFLFNVAFGICYRGPRAEMVLQDVVDAFIVALPFHHGENTIGTHYEGAREGAAAKAVGHGDKLAQVGVSLAARHTVHGVHHTYALLVITVGVLQGVAAFGDGLHLVEAGIGDDLACRGEHAFHGLGARHGVGP